MRTPNPIPQYQAQTTGRDPYRRHTWPGADALPTVDDATYKAGARAAVHWHGGQASTLYALASTGRLTIGTRPAPAENIAEALADLAADLAREVTRIMDTDPIPDDPDEADDLDSLLDLRDAAELAAVTWQHLADELADAHQAAG